MINSKVILDYFTVDSMIFFKTASYLTLPFYHLYRLKSSQINQSSHFYNQSLTIKEWKNIFIQTKSKKSDTFWINKELSASGDDLLSMSQDSLLGICHLFYKGLISISVFPFDTKHMSYCLCSVKGLCNSGTHLTAPSVFVQSRDSAIQGPIYLFHLGLFWDITNMKC